MYGNKTDNNNVSNKEKFSVLIESFHLVRSGNA